MGTEQPRVESRLAIDSEGQIRNRSAGQRGSASRVLPARRDEHGFVLPEEVVPQYREHRKRQEEIDLARNAVWDERVKSCAARHGRRAKWSERQGGAGIPPLHDLKSLCLTGIPKPMRGQVWVRVSGAHALLEKNNGKYQQLLIQCQKEPPEMERAIECDLDRTFPNHASLVSEEGQARLRRILQAYAKHNPKIGYCQSMNFLAAFLLLHMEEEPAFWVLVCITEKSLTGYFNENMKGWLVDQRVFAELLEIYLPAASSHLTSLQVPPELMCSQWFLCVFVTIFPTETVCRIWDAFLTRGVNSLFLVGLATIKAFEPKMASWADTSELFSALRTLQHSLFDADTLINSAFSHFDIDKDVTRLRKIYDKKVEQDLKFAAQGGNSPHFHNKRSIREIAVDGFTDLIRMFKSSSKPPAQAEGSPDSPEKEEEEEGATAEAREAQNGKQEGQNPGEGDVVLNEVGMAAEVVSGMVPLSALVAERNRANDFGREVENLQETLEQAQQQKYMIVHQFEADLQREKDSRMAAEAGQLEAYELVGRTRHALEVAEKEIKSLQQKLEAAEVELDRLRHD
eukprot:TRINITY_DN5918_c0_g1_i8.p1 TRINITY_DN5918_c0_g1~~TRINITY_DN5918_c0_g1_i8.p1  ORF type:complete len:570 (+),score=148.80 TRINITY_DN5918_c0_g1_i8:757-2466(+)